MRQVEVAPGVVLNVADDATDADVAALASPYVQRVPPARTKLRTPQATKAADEPEAKPKAKKAAKKA